jgi:O-antigen ligase
MSVSLEAPSINPTRGQVAVTPRQVAESLGICTSRRRARALNQALFVGISVLACATPLTYWPKSSWLCFPFYDVGIGIVFSIFAVSLFIPKPAIPRLNSLDLVLASFVVWVGVNAVTKGSWAAARPLIDLCLLLFIVEHARLSNDQLKHLLLALMLTGTFVAGLGVYEYLFEHKSRVTATLLNPNTFSGYLCWLLPMSLCLWKAEKPWVRVLGMLITTVMGFAMTISLTRGGYLAALIGMSGFALMKNKRLLPVIFVYVIFFGLAVSGARTRFSATGVTPAYAVSTEGNDTVTSRIYLWRFAWQQFKTEPLTGIGIGNYRTRLGTYVQSNTQDRAHYPEVVEPHNSYLKVLCELGLPGLALFLALLTGWMWKCAKTLLSVNSNEPTPWAAGLFWGLIAFLVHNLTNTLFMIVPCALGFWVGLGLSARMADRRGSDRLHG